MDIVAVIGGTGIYSLAMLDKSQEEEVTTSYGRVTVQVGTVAGREVVFLARHGRGHHIPPHRINYRANLAALHLLGVGRILATGSVGSLNRELQPGDLVLADQFIDLTWGRDQTFYDNDESGVVHVDVSEAYCSQLRRVVAATARELRLSVADAGTYVCTQGPRFETPAEIEVYRAMGGDVVGMTGVPEVVLARELGICYCTMAIVTNYAAGITHKPLSHAEVLDKMQENSQTLGLVIEKSLVSLGEQRSCDCAHVESPIKVWMRNQESGIRNQE